MENQIIDIIVRIIAVLVDVMDVLQQAMLAIQMVKIQIFVIYNWTTTVCWDQDMLIKIFDSHKHLNACLDKVSTQNS